MASTDAAIWASLAARPLNLPVLAPGQACPRATGATVNPNVGLALGSGPLYPAGARADGTIPFGGSPEGGWYFAKVLWVASPSYTGHALIRGHQIDGPNEVRFENGSDPPLELRFDGNPLGDGWRHQPSYTRVRAPGCYAYQVDGIGVSSVIVFEATLEN
ncbi:MAG TPA: hypothetical protein VIP07_10505 [Candidatus Limnocylindria bacterium]